MAMYSGLVNINNLYALNSFNRLYNQCRKYNMFLGIQINYMMNFNLN